MAHHSSSEVDFMALNYSELTKFFTSYLNYTSDEDITSIAISKPEVEEEDILDPKVSRFLCEILTEACDQIYILGGFENTNQIREPCKLDNMKTITEKYHGAADPVFDKDTSEPFRIAFNKKKIQKMTNDSLFVTDIISSLIQELTLKNTYIGLKDLLKDLRQIRLDEIVLTNEELTNWHQMLDLKNSLAKDEIESINKIQTLTKDIIVMNDEIADIYFENIIRQRYVHNWENARKSQNSDSFLHAEIELTQTIATYKTEIEKEIRVNAEIESFLKENETEIENSIETWQKRYDKEFEEREIQMQLLREKREDQENDYLELKGVYELHKQQIEEYLIHKEKKRVEEERLAFLYAKATKIQAWWRGLMVRLKLGPYNPKKRGKKGKGKKGAAKKK